jgi:cell division protein FtsQ
VVIGAGIVLLAALVPWGTGQVLGAMDRKVMAIDVTGELVGESRVALERSAGQWIGRSFFATDLSDVKDRLEERPWVESAAVRRVWPDRLAIEIREKKPLAYWSDGRLVSRSGEVFTPPNPEVAGRLPMLSGPDERVMDVIRMARTMSDTLTEHELGFAGLALEQRGAWTLTLSNGIEVVLGRDQVAERFDRFMTVYQERLVSRADEVERVDARYSNGLAVKWKSDAAASGKNS